MSGHRIPKRPYLLRALYEWIIDSGATPHVLIDATQEGVQVPSEHVQDGRIVLNISPSAVRGLNIGDQAIVCDGRFGGRSFGLYLPMTSVVAIYARESGEGMVFEPEAFDDAGVPEPEPPAPTPRGGHLKRIK